MHQKKCDEVSDWWRGSIITKDYCPHSGMVSERMEFDLRKQRKVTFFFFYIQYCRVKFMSIIDFVLCDLSYQIILMIVITAASIYQTITMEQTLS